jgi:hypothetical protein
MGALANAVPVVGDAILAIVASGTVDAGSKGADRKISSKKRA